MYEPTLYRAPREVLSPPNDSLYAPNYEVAFDDIIDAFTQGDREKVYELAKDYGIQETADEIKAAHFNDAYKVEFLVSLLQKGA
jgi:hypothetical protein